MTDPAMPTKAVVFDIGNVLIEWAPERYYDRAYGEARRREVFSAIDLHAMNLSIDFGADFKSTIYDWAERHPDYAAEIRDWHDKWPELATPAIPHSVRLLRALRAKGVPVYALTNFGADSFDLACTIYDFLNEFDIAFVSGKMKMGKPEAEIYAALEEGTGLSGAELIFVDDRPENIEAAAARGWRVHQFVTPEAWAERLVEEGLLSAAEAV